MSAEHKDVEQTSTRRRVLKRAAAGGAAAWAVPAVFGTSAALAAKSGGKECAKNANSGDTHPCTTCPAAEHPCANGGGFCFVDVKGCCFCGADFFCGDATLCKSNGDCPPGSRCGYSCCGPDPVCIAIATPGPTRPIRGRSGARG